MVNYGCTNDLTERVGSARSFVILYGNTYVRSENMAGKGKGGNTVAAVTAIAEIIILYILFSQKIIQKFGGLRKK